MPTLILIGGFGFLGKNLISQLFRSFNLVVFARRIDEEFCRSYPQVKAVLVDLANAEDLTRAFAEFPPDFVINLVSVVTAERKMELFESLLDSNLQILLNLYVALKDHRQLKLFLQMGSTEEYGAIPTPFQEDQREQPDSPYALVKQLTTNTAMMLFRNYGFPVSVVRLGNLIGPFQGAEKLIPYLLKNLKKGLPLAMTPGLQERDFIHAWDVALGLKSLMEAASKVRGEIVNLAYGKGVSVRAVADFLIQKLNSSSVIEWGKLPYRANEIMKFCCDMTKFTNLTGVKFAWDTFKALEHLIENEE